MSKNTAIQKSVRQSIKESGESFPLIGWTVYWSTTQFSMAFEDFVKMLDECGISSHLARETLPKHAAQRAIRESAKGKDTFHRKVADNTEEAAFVIASTEVNSNMDASFTTNSKAVFDKETKNLSVSGDQHKDIKNLFEKLKTEYTSHQVRTVILRFVKRYCSGITVMNTGGLYFVPKTSENELEKLYKLFELLGDKADITPMPLVDSAQARNSMWKVTVGEVANDIARLKADLEKQDDEITEKSYMARLRKYKALRTKVELYESVLSGTATDLKNDLDSLTKLVQTKIIK